MANNWAEVLTCKNKRRFHSQGEAKRMVTHVMKEGRGKMGTYLCDVCGGWHLTSGVGMRWKPHRKRRR